jgi:hypothetical protein
MGSRRSGIRHVFLAVSIGILALGCEASVQDQGEPLSSATLLAPSRATFPHVEDAMQMHCGTLDCHGQIGRDLRLYGLRGLRLSPNDNPLENATRREEYDASYLSIVALEPEALSLVVADRAAHPNKLTMIRKPRGIEKHKGGQLMTEGDALDTCIVAWLGGGLDDDACNTVVNTQRPEVHWQ